MSLDCLPMPPKQNALNVTKERFRRKISKLRLKATVAGSRLFFSCSGQESSSPGE